MNRAQDIPRLDWKAEKRAKYERHGMTHTPERRSWDNMRSRCYNPKNPHFDLWGGRGIEVCESWRHSFTAFYHDMGPRPSPKHSLDRINNDGNYEPGNCRWATRKEQLQNTRENVRLTHGGETLCLNEWSRRIGIDSKSITKRLRRGLSVAEALSPIRKRPKPAKLAEAQVRQILVRAHGGETYKAIAREFGVTPSNVASIFHGKTWKDLDRSFLNGGTNAQS